MAVPRDTSREGFEVLIDDLRKAGPEARVAMAAEMSDAVLELSVAGIRRQHPEFDDAQVRQALAERLLGKAVETRET